MLNLKDAFVIVTGGASGIGLASAACLQLHGSRVLVVDKNPPPAEYDYLQCDLGNASAVEDLCERISQPVFGIVNSAGVPGTAKPDEIIRVNIVGLRILTERLLPAMSSGGAIVNVGSSIAFQWHRHRDRLLKFLNIKVEKEIAKWIKENPMSGAQAYIFSKEAVLAYTQVSALSAIERGIRVNSVSPGATETPILSEFRRSLNGKIMDELRDYAGGRDARPSDIAKVVAFLLSDYAAWVNGSDIIVDGGAHVAIDLGYIA
jgi:NAD(P)-dependent dehydrogenase (short-subunit alcohol dehydrogenase family)